MKILAIVPMPFDGTSFYRAYGIFPDLKRQFANLEITAFRDGVGYTWPDLLPYDVVFLQRPAIDAGKRLKMLDYLKKMGKKIWVDWDDNLFAAPMDNRVYDDMTPEVREATAKVLLIADLVTVSTVALKEFFIEKIGCKNVEVVPNAWDFDLFPMKMQYNELKDVPPPQEKKLKFLWRGSDTHQADLLSHSEIIYKSMEHGEHWTFMGYNPWFITEAIPRERWSYQKSNDVFEYLRALKEQPAQALVFPLRDHLFNRCKSNIAWMEATYAGMVCIAPDWQEWQLPGVIKYKDVDELEQILLNFDVHACPLLWEKSQNYIYGKLALSVVNQKRIHLLNELEK